MIARALARARGTVGAVRVAELWRYPVKSFGGERLARAEVRPDGIVGDRVVRVADIGSGETVSARTRGGLVSLSATLGDDGEPFVDGRHWRDGETHRRLQEVAPGTRLLRDDSAERFDILPLLVATDGAVAAFGEDGRRLRPNLVVGGVDGLDERAWEGAALTVGEVVIGLHSLRDRCIVTTFDPDTAEQRVDVLLGIRARFAGKLALNAWVVRGGSIAVGDPVELHAADGLGSRPPGEVLGRFVS